MNKKYSILCSEQRVINNDPQRRCYNGCHFSTENIFLPEVQIDMEYATKERVKERLDFWISLNDYAVSQRGENSRNKYRIKEIE